MSSGMRTRGQKRRIGQRDVWDLIVNNDDICFQHILPRLNSMDLKWKFEVKEMSSISTLELAWENKSLWPSWWDETYFCWRVAETNKLELLK